MQSGEEQLLADAKAAAALTLPEGVACVPCKGLAVIPSANNTRSAKTAHAASTALAADVRRGLALAYGVGVREGASPRGVGGVDGLMCSFECDVCGEVSFVDC